MRGGCRFAIWIDGGMEGVYGGVDDDLLFGLRFGWEHMVT